MEARLQYAEEWSKPIADYELKRAALRAAWESAASSWAEERQRDIEAWDKTSAGYATASPEAVEEYFSACLRTVPVPTWAPSTFALHYDQSSKILVLDYQLPHFGGIQVKKVRALVHDTKLVPATKKEAAAFCERVSYFLVLRMLWEIADSDLRRVVDLACCNGHVVHDDAATGQTRTDVVLSVAASMKKFAVFGSNASIPRPASGA